MEERKPSGWSRIGTSTGHEGGVTNRINGGKRAPYSDVRRREDALEMCLQHRTAEHPIRGGVTSDSVQAPGAAANFGRLRMRTSEQVCIFNQLVLLYPIE